METLCQWRCLWRQRDKHIAGTAINGCCNARENNSAWSGRGIRKGDPREGGKKACNRSQGITKEAASTSLYYSD
jgi:hypothetical protein